MKSILTKQIQNKEEIILFELTRKGAVLFNEFCRIVQKHGISRKTVSRYLDKLFLEGKVKKDRSQPPCVCYYIPGAEERAKYVLGLYWYGYAPEIPRIGKIGEELVADAVFYNIDNEHQHRHWKVIGVRMKEHNDIMLGTSKDRNDIDVLLQNTKHDFFVNVEVRNRLKHVIEEDMDVKMENSRLAQEKWFGGREVKTALVCSFINRKVIDSLRDKGIPVVVTEKVYLPAGIDDGLFREYIKEFEYEEYMEIVDKPPVDLINRIKYLLQELD